MYRALFLLMILCIGAYLITAMAFECQPHPAPTPNVSGYNAPEVDNMTMHKFPQARSLAEVVGQDRYQMAALSERVDGIIRRGVVTRVRPTGEGFEFTFPEGVESVYLVDVDIYNPGARPVTLRGIESAIPVRPGHGVRVLIPGGDVTRGPIVMGRLTPAESDFVTLTQSIGGSVNGEYPAIGAPRVWIANIILEMAVGTDLRNPPTNPEMHYPESIDGATTAILGIETADGGEHSISIPIGAPLYMSPADGAVAYRGEVRQQVIIEIDEADDLGGRELTIDAPIDNREVSFRLFGGASIRQASHRGNQELERVSGHTTGNTYVNVSITLSEIGPGTK